MANAKKKKKPAPTIEEMYASLERARIADGGILLRPVGKHGFIELHYGQAKEALDHIARKLPSVVHGFAEFSPADKLAFILLKAHAEHN